MQREAYLELDEAVPLLVGRLDELIDEGVIARTTLTRNLSNDMIVDGYSKKIGKQEKLDISHSLSPCHPRSFFLSSKCSDTLVPM